MEEKSSDEWLWSEYYDAFPYFKKEYVRDGCHPRILNHEPKAAKAIVLVHGLSDSSYFMVDLAEYFYTALGYDVYVPLLQCHGLKKPREMEGVSLVEWKRNVRFSIEKARENSACVSIGGLSMGGALAFHLGCTDYKVTGGVYLFAAAFGLAPGRFSFVARLKEWVLRQPFVSMFDSDRSLIGDNPYRYNRVSLKSAVQLAHLMVENNKLLFEMERGRSVDKRFFLAWSEGDDVVDIKALERLNTILLKTDSASFSIPKEMKVGHACLVLKESIYAIGAESNDHPLESANPLFPEMVKEISRHDSMNC